MPAPSNGIKQPVTATASLPVMGVGLKPTPVKSNLDDLKQELDKIHTSNSSHNLKANLEANLKEIFAPTSSGTVTPAQTITNSATPTQTNTTTAATTAAGASASASASTNTGASALISTHDANQQLTDSEPHFDNKSSESFSNDEGIVFSVRPQTTSTEQTEPTETSAVSVNQTPEQPTVDPIGNNSKAKFAALDLNLDLTQIKPEAQDKSEFKEKSLSPNVDPPVVRKLSRFSVTPVRELATPAIGSVGTDGYNTDCKATDSKSETASQSLKDISCTSSHSKGTVSDRQISTDSSTESSALDFIECNNSVRNTSSQTSPTAQVLHQLFNKLDKSFQKRFVSFDYQNELSDVPLVSPNQSQSLESSKANPKLGSVVSLSSYESASSGLDQDNHNLASIPLNDCSNDNSDVSPQTTNSGADSSYHTYPGIRKYASALDLNSEGLELAIARLMHGVSLSLGHHSCCHSNSSDPNLSNVHSRRSSIQKVLIRVKDVSTQTDKTESCDTGVNTIIDGPPLELQTWHRMSTTNQNTDSVANPTETSFTTPQAMNRSCSHNDVARLDNSSVRTPSCLFLTEESSDCFSGDLSSSSALLIHTSGIDSDFSNC